MQLRQLPLSRHRTREEHRHGELRHTSANVQREASRHSLRLVYILDAQGRIPTLPPPCPAVNVDGGKADPQRGGGECIKPNSTAMTWNAEPG